MMMLIVASGLKGRTIWLLVQQSKKEGRKVRAERVLLVVTALGFRVMSRKNTRVLFYEHPNGGNEEEALFHVSRVVSASTPPSLGLQDAVSDVVRASFHLAPPADITCRKRAMISLANVHMTRSCMQLL
jgi:hypothetical protein